jgi:transposase
MWLTGRLAPDYKTLADFRKDNGPATTGTPVFGNGGRSAL